MLPQGKNIYNDDIENFYKEMENVRLVNSDGESFTVDVVRPSVTTFVSPFSDIDYGGEQKNFREASQAMILTISNWIGKFLEEGKIPQMNNVFEFLGTSRGSLENWIEFSIFQKNFGRVRNFERMTLEEMVFIEENFIKDPLNNSFPKEYGGIRTPIHKNREEELLKFGKRLKNHFLSLKSRTLPFIFEGTKYHLMKNEEGLIGFETEDSYDLWIMDDDRYISCFKYFEADRAIWTVSYLERTAPLDSDYDHMEEEYEKVMTNLNDREKCLYHLSRLHWWMAVRTPWYRGGEAIPEWLCGGVIDYLNRQEGLEGFRNWISPKGSPGVEPWTFAITSGIDRFSNIYPLLFE